MTGRLEETFSVLDERLSVLDRRLVDLEKAVLLLDFLAAGGLDDRRRSRNSEGSSSVDTL